MRSRVVILLSLVVFGCASRESVTKYWYKEWRKYEKPVPAIPGYKQRGIASWYGSKFHGRRTASGEIYNMYAFTAAHKSLPFGTYVKVRNLKNNREVIVRINDRGPYYPGRIIDLSYAAAKAIGMIGTGTAPVEITVLGKYPARIQRTLPRGLFYVQVGAFVNKANAFRLMSRLAEKGYDVMISYRTVNGRFFYRVLVGPYVERTDALRASWVLKKMGLSVRVVND